MTLFTIGIVGVGLVAIPTLITSSAYALAETFRWKDGLHRRFHAARPFYSVIILSILVGIVLDFTNVSPMKALYWSAVINGLIAPFLLVGILIVASDRKIMRQKPSPLLARLTVGLAALAMFGAAIGMFVLTASRRPQLRATDATCLTPAIADGHDSVAYSVTDGNYQEDAYKSAALPLS